MIERLFALVQDWEASGFAGLCVLALLFVIGTLSYMPRFSLYLIGGVVFGFAAIPAAIIGSTIGATGAFLLARTILRGRVRALDRSPAGVAGGARGDQCRRLAARRAHAHRRAAPRRRDQLSLRADRDWRCRRTSSATAVGLIPPVTLFAGAGALGRFALTDVEQPWSQGLAFAAGAAVIAIGVALILRRMRRTMALETEKCPLFSGHLRIGMALKPAARAAGRAARRDAAGGPCRRTAPRRSAASSARSRIRAPGACLAAGP